MPIYYILVEGKPFMFQFQVWHIIKVIPCDIRDIDRLWRQEGEPLMQLGRQITPMIFYREPANPFEEQAERPGQPGERR